MSKTYGPGNPNQKGKPATPVQDRLPENDLAYFILDTVNGLDISAITAKYEQERRGFPPYSPRMMVALLLYSHCRGVVSSRKIMQACQERLTFRAIVGDNIPNWRIISDFRKLHIKELEGLFVQILKLCQRVHLVKLGHTGLDSTKVKANVGRQKAMSYGRMKDGEQRLQHEIHRLLSEAETMDQREDQLYRTDCRGEELPEQLAHQQSCLEQIWLAKRASEAEAKASGEQATADSRSDEGPGCSRKRTVILDIPADREIHPPTWEEAARKRVEVYREVISKHKNCPRR
jgi:transposase